MRRGGRVEAQWIGGACQSTAIRRLEESASQDMPVAGSPANTTGERGTSCTDVGCTKGACVAGIVLQQS